MCGSVLCETEGKGGSRRDCTGEWTIVESTEVSERCCPWVGGVKKRRGDINKVFA